MIGEDSIKQDVRSIANGEEEVLGKYEQWMREDHRFYVKLYDCGVGEASGLKDYTLYDVRIIGINYDLCVDGEGEGDVEVARAPLMFQLVNLLNDPSAMRGSATNAGGWGSTELHDRTNRPDGDVWLQAPQRLRSLLVPVEKKYHDGGTQPYEGPTPLLFGSSSPGRPRC